MKTARLTLQRVHYMPKELEPGTLYVSEEFDVAGHLCACGCGNKVMTPLGQAEWSFADTPRGPSLRPSIGNWQLPCKSHYWIDGGRIEWSGAWSPEQVERGRRAEEARRREHYESRKPKKESAAARIKRWLDWVLSWLPWSRARRGQRSARLFRLARARAVMGVASSSTCFHTPYTPILAVP